MIRAGDDDVLARVRRMLEARGIDPDAVPGQPDKAEVDREVAAWVEERRAEVRMRRWRESMPVLYREARVDRLDERQSPDRLLAWLAGESRTLVLAGPPGTGKTFAGYALLDRAAGQGTTVAAWNVVPLLEAMRPGGVDDGAEQAVTVELLLLDDFGTAKVSEWAAEQMYRIVDARVNAGLRQVVTINATYEDLVSRWGSPTIDRILFKSEAVEFLGRSRR